MGVTRHTLHVTHHTSHVTRHMSHVTRHTSHVTRYTSHVTRHTSHVIQGCHDRGGVQMERREHVNTIDLFFLLLPPPPPLPELQHCSTILELLQYRIYCKNGLQMSFGFKKKKGGCGNCAERGTSHTRLIARLSRSLLLLGVKRVAALEDVGGG